MYEEGGNPVAGAGGGGGGTRDTSVVRGAPNPRCTEAGEADGTNEGESFENGVRGDLGRSTDPLATFPVGRDGSSEPTNISRNTSSSMSKA